MNMIGSFVFARIAPIKGKIIVELFRNAQNEPCGRIAVCPDVLQDLADNGFPAYRQEEMRLPFALGHSVAMAALTKCPLRLTGDINTWPSEWGTLTVLQ